MKYTTLNKIRSHSPCEEGWRKLLKHLGKNKADDELLPFEVILDSNGLDDALWCMRSAPEYDREWSLFAVWCARQVQNINPDPRVAAAIDAAEAFANGLTDDNAMVEAARAAMAAVAAAMAAAEAAMAAAEAAEAAMAAAEEEWSVRAVSAARAAAEEEWAAVEAARAAMAAARAAMAARAAAEAARSARAARAAMAAVEAVQSDVFRWIVKGGLTKFESEV